MEQKNRGIAGWALIIVGAVILGLGVGNLVDAISNKEVKAKYVFLFIGDGMSSSHVDVTESYLSYKAGKQGEQLSFTKFPVYGTCTTHSADRLVTDSAASGTAISTGSKTNNGYIGVDTEGNSLVSTSYVLEERGYNIGIISSVPINHATPASFFGHNIRRGNYYELTQEIPASGFEYFASAGILQYFGQEGKSQNSAEWLEENGMDVCFGKAEFEEAAKTSERIVLCQEYNKDVEPKNYDSTGIKPESEISLAEMVKYGIDFLGDEEPFFIVCEGGEIDWASHGNKTMPMIISTIGFSDAVAVAYDFYLQHPDETLIIVTADHETGGVSLGGGRMGTNPDWAYMDSVWVANNQSNTLDGRENMMVNGKGRIGWTSYDHTGGAVPVYAIGQGAEKFAGRIDNTDIKGKILSKAY